MINRYVLATCGIALCSPVLADDDANQCAIPSVTVNKIQGELAKVVPGPMKNGGIFSPNLMWSAVVDRAGRL